MSSSPSSRSAQASGTDRRCTKCGSRVRPEENWCSLCHTSIAAPGKGESEWGSIAALVDELGDIPADEPQPPPDSAAEPESAADDSATDASGDDSATDASGDDSATDDEDANLDRSAARAEAALAADRLLTELAAAEARRKRESGLNALQDKLGVGGRSTAVLIAAVGGALLLILTILGMTLLGLLL
jgi:hypothetical protein